MSELQKPTLGAQGTSGQTAHNDRLSYFAGRSIAATTSPAQMNPTT